MLMIDDPKNKAAIAVFKSLPSNVGANNGADPDEWAPVDAVATATGLKPATVSGILRRLDGEGTVERFRQGRSFVWRRRAEFAPAESAAEPSADAGAPAPTRKPRKAASGATRPVKAASAAKAGPAPSARADCVRCGKPSHKLGRVRVHSHPRTEVAADHKATVSKTAGRTPMKGKCTVCSKPMTKDGRSWSHDDKSIGGHTATAAVQRAGVGRNVKPVEQSTMVAADLGAELKARLVEHAGSRGLSVADAVRQAIEAYLPLRRTKRSANR